MSVPQQHVNGRIFGIFAGSPWCLSMISQPQFEQTKSSPSRISRTVVPPDWRCWSISTSVAPGVRQGPGIPTLLPRRFPSLRPTPASDLHFDCSARGQGPKRSGMVVGDTGFEPVTFRM